MALEKYMGNGNKNGLLLGVVYLCVSIYVQPKDNYFHHSNTTTYIVEGC